MSRGANPWAMRHRSRALERLDRAYALVGAGELDRAREELVLARDDFNDAREPGLYRHVGRVLEMDDDQLRHQARRYRQNKNGFPRADAGRWSMGVRTPNMDPATAAALTGAIGATTTATIQGMANNPSVRYTAVRSGDLVAIVRGGGKLQAMAKVESMTAVGADRASARTFDTKHEAVAYARSNLGEPSIDLDIVPSEKEIQAIKRRVLR